ncbi:MAG: STAS domain-containing protein [Anaerolineaceae bacterium]|nr:MAG: STAS domain-containing protein [Anaerolineaceae bacterium]
MKTQTKEFEGIPVLELSGRFDAHTVPQVSDWIKIKMTDQPHLVIDLVNVTFVDSAALATLVQGMKQCREQDGDLLLCRLAQPVRIIFELTRLDRAFAIFDSVPVAVASLKSPAATA